MREIIIQRDLASFSTRYFIDGRRDPLGIIEEAAIVRCPNAYALHVQMCDAIKASLDYGFMREWDECVSTLD